jgi:hypothetical protein
MQDFCLKVNLLYRVQNLSLPIHKVWVKDQIVDVEAQPNKMQQTKNTGSITNSLVSPPADNIDHGLMFVESVCRKFGHSVNFVSGFRKGGIFPCCFLWESNL